MNNKTNTKVKHTPKFPLAACQICGGWASCGGMSQYRHTVDGCNCGNYSNDFFRGKTKEEIAEALVIRGKELERKRDEARTDLKNAEWKLNHAQRVHAEAL